jgi:hypothetical protein
VNPQCAKRRDAHDVHTYAENCSVASYVCEAATGRTTHKVRKFCET